VVFRIDVTSSTSHRRRATLVQLGTEEMTDVQTTRARHALVAIALVLPLNGSTVGGVADVTVDAALTVSTELPERSRRVLMQEAESIWRSAGVRIHWLDARDGDAATPALRVHVVRHAGARTRADHWVVGELLRFEDGAAIAFASIARAETVVRAAGTGPVRATPESVLHDRLGIVLGRAVAHEIGHYLLESGTHTGRGLMRATFQPREFTDLRSGGFELDETSQRRIRARLLGRPAQVVLRPPGRDERAHKGAEPRS
jgi:hypothetical protein